MGGLKVRTAICYGFGDYKSPGLIGQTFFTTDFKSVGTPNGGWDAWRCMGRLAGCGTPGGGGIFRAQKKSWNLRR